VEDEILYIYPTSNEDLVVIMIEEAAYGGHFVIMAKNGGVVVSTVSRDSQESPCNPSPPNFQQHVQTILKSSHPRPSHF